MKKIIYKLEKMLNAIFSETTQNKLFAWIFGIMSISCFIVGFWNNLHFLTAAMCGVMAYLLIDELR